MQTIKEANISNGMRVLVRCDLDVPIKNGKIQNNYRLLQSFGTIDYILSKGGKPILCGHIGDPKGSIDMSLSTQPVKEFFAKKYGSSVSILENIRFNPGEESNDPEFAKELAQLADIYVNDAFATCHRKHASIVGVSKYLKSYMGCRLELEITTLNKIINKPERPLIAIVGGIKLESKKPALLKFLDIADAVLVGGKLGANWDEKANDKLLLPIDYATDSNDIGEKTIQNYIEIIMSAKSIVWAGPLGFYENENFRLGTKEIAKAISARTKEGAFSVAGGGNTIEALEMFDMLQDISFISTGGGAMLEYIVAETLPGIEALN